MICRLNSGEYAGRVMGMEQTSCKSMKGSMGSGQLQTRSRYFSGRNATPSGISPTLTFCLYAVTIKLSGGMRLP
jgi:hypothetical protein